MRRIYVETHIRTSMADLWEHTQDPAQHQRWDLRFQRISYLPKEEADEPQRFGYSTAGIDGIGISVAERTRPDGSATSVLLFTSRHPLSVIRNGSGYWRYVPVVGGIRFLTGYGYEPRGRVYDALFGPLMGWATAWSFDRLRIWLELGVTPESGFRRAVADVAARAACVIALTLIHPVAGLAGLVGALVTPPGRRTPSARRCLRRAPDAASGTAPRSLILLEKS